jgi:hypothetical protein
MAEFTYSVTATGLMDPRVEELEDLYEALVSRPDILGPAVGGNLQTGEVDVILTVEARAAEDAATRALRAVRAALVETGRSASVGTVTSESVPA